MSQNYTYKQHLTDKGIAPLTLAAFARAGDFLSTHIGLYHFDLTEVGTAKYFMHWLGNIDAGMIAHDLAIYGPAFYALYLLQQNNSTAGRVGFGISTAFTGLMLTNNISCILGHPLLPGLGDLIATVENTVCETLSCIPLEPYKL